MDYKELLEQANSRVVQMNQLMRDVEMFEDIIEVAKGGEVAFHQNGVGTTFIANILNQDKMDELKNIVMDAMTGARDSKVVELESLLGKAPEQRKVASINPTFEKAVQEMEKQHGNKKAEEVVKVITDVKPELTVELVKEFYHDKDMSLEAIAKETGIARSTLHTFITKNNLRKPNKKEQEVFRDSKVKKETKKEHP